MKLWIVLTVVIVAGLAAAQKDATKPPLSNKEPAKTDPAKPAKTEPAKQAQDKKEPQTKPTRATKATTAAKEVVDPFPAIQKDFESFFSASLKNHAVHLERIRNFTNEECVNLQKYFNEFARYATNATQLTNNQTIIAIVQKVIDEARPTISKCTVDQYAKLFKQVEDELKKWAEDSAKTVEDNKKNPNIKACASTCKKQFGNVVSSTSDTCRRSIWNSLTDYRINPIKFGRHRVVESTHSLMVNVETCRLREATVSVSQCLNLKVN
jgi:hypothetical protein